MIFTKWGIHNRRCKNTDASLAVEKKIFVITRTVLFCVLVHIGKLYKF